MRIGIDARFYGPSGKGLGRYTQKLIKNLEEVDDQNQYIVFLRRENWDDFKPTNKNFTKVLADYRWYTLQEQIKMPKLIKKYNVDLMHFPHFNIPILYRGDFTVTIHDLILIKYPTKKATTLDPFTYKIKYYGYKKVIARAVKKAKKIITVSEFTKKELVDYFKIDSDKIAVTYEACDHVESGQLSLPDYNFLKDYGINKSYILYVGNAYPHKNLEGLLHAYNKIVKDKKIDGQLVFVGKEDYFYKRLKEEARGLGLLKDDKVVFFGFATEKQLADLYRHAKAYVFPSFIEGFGLPPLEAMSYGLPVVASNTSCLPEILGEAAEYFNPHSEEDMVEKISSIFNDEDLQKKMKDRGYIKVKEYNWQRCAQETLEVYNKMGE